MKNVFPLLLLAVLSLAAFMPKTGAILTGKITGNTGEALIGASVKVLKGTELIRGAISDLNGVYRVEVEPGTYDVEFSYTGLKPNGSPV